MANLLESIKKAGMTGINATNPVHVLFGDVLSVNPLRINVEQRFTLTEEFLILTESVKRKTINLTHNHSFDGGTTTSSLSPVNLSHSHPYSGGTTESALDTFDLEHNHMLDDETTTNSLSPINLQHSHTYGGGTTEQALDTIELTHNHQYDGGTTHNALSTIVIREGLQTGDKVILLRMQGGQQYVVMDKVG